jgi:hypothetical protein
MNNRLKLLCHPAAIRLFCKSYAMFRADPRCSLLNLLRSAWRSAGEEKVVPYEGKLVYSSFLPPIPSKAADQVLDVNHPAPHGLKGPGCARPDEGCL